MLPIGPILVSLILICGGTNYARAANEDAPSKPDINSSDCEAPLLGDFTFHSKVAWRDTVALLKEGKLGDGSPFVDALRKDGRFYEWSTLHPERRNIIEIPAFIAGKRLDYLIKTKQVSERITYTGTQFELREIAGHRIREHIRNGDRVTEEFLRVEIDPIFLSWQNDLK